MHLISEQKYKCAKKSIEILDKLSNSDRFQKNKDIGLICAQGISNFWDKLEVEDISKWVESLRTLSEIRFPKSEDICRVYANGVLNAISRLIILLTENESSKKRREILIQRLRALVK